MTRSSGLALLATLLAFPVLAADHAPRTLVVDSPNFRPVPIAVADFLADRTEGMAASTVRFARWTDVGAEGLARARVWRDGLQLSAEMVLFPAPDMPVNQTVNPLCILMTEYRTGDDCLRRV